MSSWHFGENYGGQGKGKEEEKGTKSKKKKKRKRKRNMPKKDCLKESVWHPKNITPIVSCQIGYVGAETWTMTFMTI